LRRVARPPFPLTINGNSGRVTCRRPDGRVHGAFCFVEGDLPLLGTPEIRGFPLLHRRLLADGSTRTAR